jgi:hypothetical protein
VTDINLRFRGRDLYGSASFLAFAAAGTLLLDLYPNALGAYSFRKLRTAYAGSAARLQRSSDSEELDVGFVDDEFDVVTAAAFIGATTTPLVVTLYDQSGNGYDLDATDLSFPIYQEAGINGKPALLINAGAGSGRGIRSSVDSVAFSGTDISGSLVIDFDTDLLANARLLQLDANGANDFTTPSIILLMGSGTSIVQGYSSGNLDTSGTLSAQLYALMSIADGANHTMYVDGAGSGSPVGFSSTVGAGGGNTIAVGAGLTGGVGEAVIGEAIIWPSDQTASV